MIQYVCDLCHAALDPQHDLSYVVRMEIYAAPGEDDSSRDDDRDYLEDIHEILERLDDSDPDDRELSADTYQKRRYDLCRDCCQRFLQDPLGRRPAQKFDFSKR